MARIHVELSIDIPKEWSREQMADYIFDAVRLRPIGKPEETLINTRTLKMTFRDRGQRAVFTRKDSAGKTAG